MLANVTTGGARKPPGPILQQYKIAHIFGDFLFNYSLSCWYPFGFWYDGEEEGQVHVRNGRMARAPVEGVEAFNNRLYNVLGKWVIILMILLKGLALVQNTS